MLQRPWRAVRRACARLKRAAVRSIKAMEPAWRLAARSTAAMHNPAWPLRTSPPSAASRAAAVPPLVASVPIWFDPLSWISHVTPHGVDVLAHEDGRAAAAEQQPAATCQRARD